VSCVLALAILVAAGCGERQRTNPLDPANPQTGGDPWNLSVVAADRRVTLRWTPFRFDDLAGYRIERVSTALNDTTRFELPATTSELVDSLVTNRIQYRYRFLPFIASGQIVAPLDSLLATPGPEVAWVADTGGFRVQQVAPDGRAISLSLGGFRAPNSVSVSAFDGRVWVADTFNGRVVALDRAGRVIAENDAPRRPKAVAAARDGSVWVADEGSGGATGGVFHVGPSGSTLLGITGFARPADVAVTPAGGAWLCDQETGFVWRFSADGDTLLRVDRYREPLQLASVGDGTVWLTDDTLEVVAHLDTDGRELAIWSLERPFGIVVDPSDGSIWLTLFDGNRVEHWSSDGRRLLSVPGFMAPLGIDLNPRDGSLWVVDNGVEQVVKLSPSGTELARLSGFDTPFDVSVDPGP
jgi:DNA-binding beta-propeller fold protein YncE